MLEENKLKFSLKQQKKSMFYADDYFYIEQVPTNYFNKCYKKYVKKRMEEQEKKK